MSSDPTQTGLFACSDTQQWDAFCLASPQSSPCMLSWFQDVVSEETHRWVYIVEGRVLAAVAIAMENGVPMMHAPALSVHQGIIFSPELSRLSRHDRIQEMYRLMDAILLALVEHYPGFHLCFSPEIEDIRAAQWLHYHEAEKGQPQIQLRYTAYLELSKDNTVASWIAAARRDRRADYKKTEKNGLLVEDCSDVAELGVLYRKTFERQGIELKETQLGQVLTLARHAQDPVKGFILLARTDTGAPAAATVILTDRRNAYSLITANDPEFRNTGANTRLVIDALVRSQARGLEHFDFVGINSPQRGEFKMSFNAKPRPYFEMLWRRPTT